MNNNFTKCAFVSTNSIVQGEMVDILWKQFFEEYNYDFDFIHKSFKWNSEAKNKASVIVVIIGFSKKSFGKKKIIYTDNIPLLCNNINPYIMDAPNVFISKSQIPLNELPPMTKGSQLIDDGNYVFNTEAEYLDFINKEPKAKKFIKKYYNAHNLLNEKESMYALYLEDATPQELTSMKHVFKRVMNVKTFRASSSAKSVNILKDTPSKYFISNLPKINALAIPVVSSEKRKYIPIQIVKENVILTNAINFINNSSLYLFGLLMSNVHNNWMKTFAGRLKNDYRYSKDLIYNTFPVPNLTEIQKEKIECTAQNIIDVRELFPDSSLSSLYN